MRESNFRSAVTNRASVNITNTLYDRRALDCTSDRPLINSLNHLAYLTSSAARVRDTLCFDGGLERLVAILKECRDPVRSGGVCDDGNCYACSAVPGSPSSQDSDAPACTSEALVAWKWSLALQCLLFLGTRGTEVIRRRVVEAGAIPVIATVLDNYNLTLKEAVENGPLTAETVADHVCDGEHHCRTDENEHEHDHDVDMNPPSAVTSRANSTVVAMADGLGSDALAPATLEASVATMASTDSAATAEGSLMPMTSAVMSRAEQFVSQQLAGAPVVNQPHTDFSLMSTSNSGGAAPRSFRDGILVARDEDVIWSLEILAFVSKYAYLKPKLQATHFVPSLSTRDPHSAPLMKPEFQGRMYVEPCRDYDSYDFENIDDVDEETKTESLNIFPLVEQFTARKFPREVPYWAGIIMRNSCRKDENRGGIRQCANFDCGRWEEYPRQFAKCRRCKRTKYCSKQCQLAAWTFHRHWCAPATTSTSSRSVATADQLLRPQSAGNAVEVMERNQAAPGVPGIPGVNGAPGIPEAMPMPAPQLPTGFVPTGFDPAAAAPMPTEAPDRLSERLANNRAESPYGFNPMTRTNETTEVPPHARGLQ